MSSTSSGGWGNTLEQVQSNMRDEMSAEAAAVMTGLNEISAGTGRPLVGVASVDGGNSGVGRVLQSLVVGPGISVLKSLQLQVMILRIFCCCDFFRCCEWLRHTHTHTHIDMHCIC